jgi:hypothetical protein
LLLVVCAIVANAAPKDPANFYAVLKGAAGITDTGFCLFRYNVDTMILYSHCEHNIAAAVTQAHIHGATNSAADAAGTGTAGVLVDFATGIATTSIVHTSAKLEVATEAALFDGLTYVNLHTEANPGGRIRGQVVASGAASYVAELDTQQAAKTGAATGVAWIVRNAETPAKLTISWFWTATQFGTTTNNVTQAHLHGSADALPGTNGGVIQGLGNANGQLCVKPGCVTPFTLANQNDLTGDSLTWLNGGTTYFNFHTDANAGGEMRGQVNKLVAITKPVRGAASSLSVGLGALAASIVLAFVAARV